MNNTVKYYCQLYSIVLFFFFFYELFLCMSNSITVLPKRFLYLQKKKKNSFKVNNYTISVPTNVHMIIQRVCVHVCDYTPIVVFGQTRVFSRWFCQVGVCVNAYCVKNLSLLARRYYELFFNRSLIPEPTPNAVTAEPGGVGRFASAPGKLG